MNLKQELLYLIEPWILYGNISGHELHIFQTLMFLDS